MSDLGVTLLMPNREVNISFWCLLFSFLIYVQWIPPSFVWEMSFRTRTEGIYSAVVVHFMISRNGKTDSEYSTSSTQRKHSREHVDFSHLAACHCLLQSPQHTVKKALCNQFSLVHLYSFLMIHICIYVMHKHKTD